MSYVCYKIKIKISFSHLKGPVKKPPAVASAAVALAAGNFSTSPLGEGAENTFLYMNEAGHQR